MLAPRTTESPNLGDSCPCVEPPFAEADVVFPSPNLGMLGGRSADPGKPTSPNLGVLVDLHEADAAEAIALADRRTASHAVPTS